MYTFVGVDILVRVPLALLESFCTVCTSYCLFEALLGNCKGSNLDRTCHMLLSPKRMATAWNWILVLLGMGRILRVACALRGSLMRAEVGTNLSQSTFPGTEGQGICGWESFGTRWAQRHKS